MTHRSVRWLKQKKCIIHSSLETWKTNTKKLEVAEGFCTVLYNLVLDILIAT